MTTHVPNVPSLACSDERTSLDSTSPKQAKKHNEMASSDCSKEHNAISSSHCSQKKSKKRCYSTHPQVLRPKRPRSAYNLFFKDQRSALLLDAGEDLSDDEEEQSERFKVAIVTESQSSAPQPSLNQDKPKRARGRPRGPNYKPRKKRRGAFSFSQLAQLIGPNWKSLEPAVKSEYQGKAVIELENYKKAMKIYNDTIVRLEKIQESKESKQNVCCSVLISESSHSVTTHASVSPVEISNGSTIGSETESVVSSLWTSNDEVYQPLSASLLRQFNRSKSSERRGIDENDEYYSDGVSSISDCSKASSLSSFAINNLNQVSAKLHKPAQTSSMVLSNVNALHKIESEHQVRVSKNKMTSENTKVQLPSSSNSTRFTKKKPIPRIIGIRTFLLE